MKKHPDESPRLVVLRLDNGEVAGDLTQRRRIREGVGRRRTTWGNGTEAGAVCGRRLAWSAR